MVEIQRPWQNGSTELIDYALQHIRRGTELDERIGFLLLDVGVEMMIKTFLLQSDEINEAQAPYHERKQATKGNFHALMLGLESAAGERLSSHNLTDMRYFHDLRNKLYHQGDGMAISSERARDYAALSLRLLRDLLGVDLSSDFPEFAIQQTGQSTPDDLQRIVYAFREVELLLNETRYELEFTARAGIERIDPKLALPSFREWYEQYVDTIYDRNIIKTEESGLLIGGMFRVVGKLDDDGYNRDLKAMVTQVLGDGIEDDLFNEILGCISWHDRNEPTDISMEILLPFLEHKIRKTGVEPQVGGWYFTYADDFMGYQAGIIMDPDPEYDENGILVGLEYPSAEELRTYGESQMKKLQSIKTDIRLWIESEELLEQV